MFKARPGLSFSWTFTSGCLDAEIRISWGGCPHDPEPAPPAQIPLSTTPLASANVSNNVAAMTSNGVNTVRRRSRF